MLGVPRTGRIRTLREWAALLTTWVPSERWRRALGHNFRLIGLEHYERDDLVSVANQGLERHFRNLFRTRPCLVSRARQYYQEINKIDSSVGAASRSQPSDPDYVPLGRSLESLDRTDIQPGWAWALALRYADQNPLDAISIIGVCGHDDVHFDRVHFGAIPYGTVDKAAIVNEAAPELDQLLSWLDERSEESVAARWSAISLRRGRNCIDRREMLRVFPCPKPDSVFFMPGALGKSYQYSDELRERIRRIQGPTRRSGPLAEKAYHILAAAFLGCEMRASGTGPRGMRLVLHGNVRGYRAFRTCSAVNTGLRVGRELSERFENYRKDNPDIAKGTNASALRGFKRDLAQAFFQSVRDESCQHPLTGACLLYERIYLATPDLSESGVLEHIDRMIEQADAAALYRQWYFGSEAFGVSIPCSDVRWGGPRDLMTSDEKACGPRYSEERCRAALRRLATWQVDLEWSGSAQEIGADFALHNCPAMDGLLNRDMSCRSGDTFELEP